MFNKFVRSLFQLILLLKKIMEDTGKEIRTGCGAIMLTILEWALGLLLAYFLAKWIFF